MDHPHPQTQHDTQYYQRLLLSGDKPPVVEEMKQNTAPYQTREFKQAEFIKDPYMIEFLGLPEDERMRESTLEAALLANLQSFLLELGKAMPSWVGNSTCAE